MSQKSVRQNYIQADVLSATPQKLQLLLVEAAMKNILKTKRFWEDGNISDAFETLTRAQDIVAEILCSLDVENSPEIAKKLASIYVFIFRRLCDAGMSHDPQKLDDAYRVLSSERETWKLVCEKFGSSKNEAAVSSVGEAAQTPAANQTPSASAWSTSAGNLPGDSGTYTNVNLSATYTRSTPSEPAPEAPKAGTYQSPPLASAPTSPVTAPPLGSGFPGMGTPNVLPPQSPMFHSPMPPISFAGSPLGTIGAAPMNVALPPQSPGTHTVKPTSQTLENPLGSVDLVNPLGQSGTLPKLDPMSNPPQNANSPTQATDLGNLQSPSRPIPLNQGTAIKTSGFSWDG